MLDGRSSSNEESSGSSNSGPYSSNDIGSSKPTDNSYAETSNDIDDEIPF